MIHAIRELLLILFFGRTNKIIEKNGKGVTE